MLRKACEGILQSAKDTDSRAFAQLMMSDCAEDAKGFVANCSRILYISEWELENVAWKLWTENLMQPAASVRRAETVLWLATKAVFMINNQKCYVDLCMT